MNYRKIRKLIINPKMFFIDYLNKKIKEESSGKVVKKHKGNVTVAFGFNLWKRAFLEKYLPSVNYEYIPLNATEKSFPRIKELLSHYHGRVDVLAWGKKLPAPIFDFCNENSISVKYMEDGFVRSVRLGVEHVWPRSLTVDRLANHFEYQKETELERLLKTHIFDDSVLARSRKLRELIVSNNISKYNNSRLIDNIDAVYGVKDKKRVLVIGQIESDASIKFGSEFVKTTYELLRLACEENPDAQIIYKEHPDILIGKQSNSSDMTELLTRCWVLKKDIPLSQAFHQVDHVYVITSLSGFEALIRGIKVTVLGCPFYSGWGLTDDRQKNPRRNRKLTIDELFAGAYILYPKYYDPETGLECSPEDAVYEIIKEREEIHGQGCDSHLQTCKVDDIATPPVLGPTETSIASANVAEVAEIAITIPDEKLIKKVSEVDSSVLLVQEQLNKNEQSSVTVKNAGIETGNIPKCYISSVDDDVFFKANDKNGCYIYFPWIYEHSDVLLLKLKKMGEINVYPLELFSGLSNDETRRQISKFSRDNPGLYRQMIVRRLAPLRNRVSGVIFTFDWAAPMRIISSVCLELGIPRILIPHESVFVDRDKYYWDVTGQASLPATDVILGWGSLQKEIFVERGYPAERFHIVGAPKFDSYHNYQPYLEREQFCQLHGLDPDKKIILFAAQPLDSQMDQAQARASQHSAIQDLILYTAEHNLQLLIRTPPSKDAIINMALRQLMDKHHHVAVDNALCYMVTPEETLFHCDVITSINSTMLFEGALLGKPVFSMKYIEFTQLWERVGIPAARAYAELESLLFAIEQNNWQQIGLDFSWAAEALGVGQFDGQATTRITQYLANFAKARPDSFTFNKPLDNLFNGKPLDVVAIPSSEKTLATVQCYLQQQLQARTMVSTHGKIDLPKLCSVDIFFQWGITPNENKIRQAKLARSLGKVRISRSFLPKLTR